MSERERENGILLRKINWSLDDDDFIDKSINSRAIWFFFSFLFVV